MFSLKEKRKRRQPLKVKQKEEGIDMRKNYFIVAIIALIVGGCAVGGRYHTPPVKTDAAYPNNPATDTITALKWFDLYKDETLKSLIKTVLDSNRNLLSATARIEEARERAGIVRSNFW